jgi:hypothetical protein
VTVLGPAFDLDLPASPTGGGEEGGFGLSPELELCPPISVDGASMLGRGEISGVLVIGPEMVKRLKAALRGSRESRRLDEDGRRCLGGPLRSVPLRVVMMPTFAYRDSRSGPRALR